MRTSVETSGEPVLSKLEKQDDFCLADSLVQLSDDELDRLADEEAQAEVTSSAYEGIPLDKEFIKAGLIESYRKLRAERA